MKRNAKTAHKLEDIDREALELHVILEQVDAVLQASIDHLPNSNPRSEENTKHETFLFAAQRLLEQAREIAEPLTNAIDEYRLAQLPTLRAVRDGS